MTALSFSKAPKWDADCCSREGCIGRARYVIEFLEVPSGLKCCTKHRRAYELDYTGAFGPIGEALREAERASEGALAA